MIGVLRAHVHKEIIEHRVVLVVLASLAPLAAALVAAFVQLERDKSVLSGVIAAVCAWAAVAALGIDGIAGEVAGRGPVLLRRLPRGLLLGFVAKVTVAAAVTLAMAVWAYAAAEAVQRALVGGAGAGALPGWGGWLAVTAWGGAVALAVACWLPRTGLALAVTAALVALVVLPDLIGMANHLDLGWTKGWTTWHWLLGIVAGLVVAGVSFVFGYRRGGGPERAAAVGVPLMIGCALPLLVPEARLLWALGHCDPTSASFRIDNALAGEGGWLYVNARDFRSRMHYALRVSIATGDWQQLPGIDRGFESAGWTADAFTGDDAGWHRVIVALGGDAKVWRDAATFVELGRSKTREVPKTALAAARASLAATTLWRTPAGEPLWALEDRLEASSASGGVRVLADDVHGFLVGYAAQLDHRRDGPWFDVTRERVLPTVPWPYERDGKVVRSSPIVIADGSWLVRARDAASETTSWADILQTTPWKRMDPETGAVLGPAPGLHVGDQNLWPLDDGRVLVRGARELAIADPRSGDRRGLTIVGLQESRLCGFRVVGRAPSGALVLGIVVDRAPSGALVLRIGHGLARLDLDDHRLIVAPCHDEPLRLIACEDEDTLLVSTDRTIERIHFSRPEREIVFPRPAP